MRLSCVTKKPLSRGFGFFEMEKRHHFGSENYFVDKNSHLPRHASWECWFWSARPIIISFSETHMIYVWEKKCNGCCWFLFQVATGQVASTGIVALGYVQKVSEKVTWYLCGIFYLSSVSNFDFLFFFLHSGFSSYRLHVQLYV